MAVAGRKILVPVNGDRASVEAFRLACELSKESKAGLHALHILEVAQELPVDAEVDSAHGEEVLSRIEAVSAEQKCRVEAEYIQARRAGAAIVQEAQNRGAELIVLGIPYKQNLGQFVIGPTASYVLKNSPCPVIVWREESRNRR